MRRHIPSVFSSLRARLILGFLLVVSITLVIVLVGVPRLIDAYFLQQAQDDLDRRTGQAGLLVTSEIVKWQGANGAPQAIIEGDPPQISPGLDEDLQGFLSDLADTYTYSNVSVEISDVANPGTVYYQLEVPVNPQVAQAGQQQEQLTSEGGQASKLQVADTFWSQSSAAAPDRLVTVWLSDPFTFRAQSLNAILAVMAVASVIALLIAVIASVLIANRLSNPIRRLATAARELSEGKLETRVTAPSNSREMAELTTAFNSMAERVQESVEYIRRDRDRSRDFLADVSHELKTPIAALRTFNELLTEGQVGDEATQHEFLEQSRQQIDRLDWLAANLLELSKLESGLVLLDLRPDDLRTVVEGAVQQAQPAARRKGVKIETMMPKEPIRQLHDPQRMGQVLGNLLGNAIKFTPRGGKIEVSLEATDGGAELHVADTGVGINAAELPYVFDRFYRGAQAHESRAAGSGLGLSIVRSIVEMHNGRVVISSTPGKGTDVSVDLPRDVAVSSPAAVRA